jgi:hypothetical protein
MTGIRPRVDAYEIARLIDVSLQWMRQSQITHSTRDYQTAMACGQVALERTRLLKPGDNPKLIGLKCLEVVAQIQTEDERLREIMRECMDIAQRLERTAQDVRETLKRAQALEAIPLEPMKQAC